MKGKTVLGTGSLSGGSASFTTAKLPVGTDSITAIYGGDSNFDASTSNVVAQVVKKLGPSRSRAVDPYRSLTYTLLAYSVRAYANSV